MSPRSEGEFSPVEQEEQPPQSAEGNVNRKTPLSNTKSVVYQQAMRPGSLKQL